MSFLPALTPEDEARARRQRIDGWTPDRQRAFLEAIAEGHSVESACRLVGMSQSSAYALRRRAAGQSFALGWEAAALLARGRIADTLLARAIDGQVDTYTRADGATLTRHRYDNRLAAQMLARLDRYADDAAPTAAHHAARLVAAEFDQYLDMLDAGDGPARAGLFLGARLAADEVDADLKPVLALARADRWLRSGRALADDVDVSDLDPAARAEWSADQWQRAEAAGLVALAGPAGAAGEAQGDSDEVEEDAPASPLSPLHLLEAEEEPVWFDEDAREWRTLFPPPPGFDGFEDGDYGDDCYWRELSDAERAIAEARRAADRAEARDEALRERDAWFADD